MRTMKYIYRILPLMLLMFVATACERRSLVELNEGGVKVNLNVDWAKFGTTPDKMTLMFYPENGGDPIVRVCDDVKNVTTTLPPGKYKVVVMNDEVKDFGCYDITLSPEFGVTLKDGEQPVPLGVDMGVDYFEVKEPVIHAGEDGNLVQDEISVTVPTLHPENILWSGCVDVNVCDFGNVKGISGSLSGLAAKFGDSKSTASVTLTDWEQRSGDKSFVKNFVCLGLPAGHSGTAEENTLHLDFVLNDKSTVTQDITVGNLIEVDSESRTLNIKLTTIVSETAGYDVTVEPWQGEDVVNGTRGDVSYEQSLYDNGFKMNVLWNDRYVYNNVTAYWENLDFKTDKEVYWPAASETYPCVFHALSYPGVGDKSFTNSTFEYTVPNKVENHKDVLVSSVSATNIPENGRQELVFTHALTKVNFTLYVEDTDKAPLNDGCVWRISSVSLKAKNSGTYTYDAKTPWAVSGTAVDMEYLKANETKDIEHGKQWKGDNNMMLIPQGTEDLQVTVKWNVYRKTSTGALIKVSKGEAVKSYTISVNDWRPGVSKRYSGLRLPNVGEGFDSTTGYDENNISNIEYDPSTEGWETK